MKRVARALVSISSNAECLENLRSHGMTIDACKPAPALGFPALFLYWPFYPKSRLLLDFLKCGAGVSPAIASRSIASEAPVLSNRPRKPIILETLVLSLLSLKSCYAY
jgi:hypothetical protein